MPPLIDQFDVFTIPHCRMKKLVKSCTDKLTITDFTNNDALFILLNSLYGVFKEFKSHEEIENEFIMRKLKLKLREMQVHNSAVCNCHKDDQFTPLIDLVDSGYIYINKHTTVSDRMGYGVKLRKALKEFASEFIPHMKEEEEVFQPLLLQYLNEDELVEMKTLVIRMHLQKSKQAGVDDGKIELDNRVRNRDRLSDFNDLPDELLMKIFSYLKQKDLLGTAMVSKKWNNLACDQFRWKKLSFSEWITNSKPSDQRVDGYKDIDYIDDSDEEFDSNENICINEVKLLHYWIKRLLPRIGQNVEFLDLSNCKSINNNLARRIFQLCPNLRILNISYTSIGDNAFKRVSFKNLEYINFESCEKFTDNSFNYLFMNDYKFPLKNKNTSDDLNIQNEIKYGGSVCWRCLKKYRINANIEEISDHNANIENYSNAQSNNKIVEKNVSEQVSLSYLNLSGCHSITDETLKYISLKFDLKLLNYLNLSGCLNVTSIGLNNFVKLCVNLNPENLYYCDNIVNGPFDGMANGCENVECTKKFCCRNMSFN